MTTNPLIYTV